jgi:hypothetical protein
MVLALDSADSKVLLEEGRGRVRNVLILKSFRAGKKR